MDQSSKGRTTRLRVVCGVSEESSRVDGDGRRAGQRRAFLTTIMLTALVIVVAVLLTIFVEPYVTQWIEGP